MIFRKKVEDKVAEKIATKTFDKIKKKKPVCKTSLIRDILENTDDYELVARKEGEEFVIRVRKPYMTVSTISQDYVNKGGSFMKGDAL